MSDFKSILDLGLSGILAVAIVVLGIIIYKAMPLIKAAPPINGTKAALEAINEKIEENKKEGQLQISETMKSITRLQESCLERHMGIERISGENSVRFRFIEQALLGANERFDGLEQLILQGTNNAYGWDGNERRKGGDSKQ
jgi:hypothetical protein